MVKTGKFNLPQPKKASEQTFCEKYKKKPLSVYLPRRFEVGQYIHVLY